MTTPPPEPRHIPAVAGEELWEEAGWLPCMVSVALPLQHFTVRTLLQLERGSVVESNLAEGADLPVFVNSQLIGWGEFEIVREMLAIRLAELA